MSVGRLILELHILHLLLPFALLPSSRFQSRAFLTIEILIYSCFHDWHVDGGVGRRIV